MAERNTAHRDGEVIAMPVAASTKVEAGNLVALNASGYLVPAADTAGLTVVGVAGKTQDNSAGANGALNCLVRRRKVFLFENHASYTTPVSGFVCPDFERHNGGTNVPTIINCIDTSATRTTVSIYKWDAANSWWQVADADFWIDLHQ